MASGVVVAMLSLARTTLLAAAEGSTVVEADTTTSSSTGAAVEGVVAADAVGVDRNRIGWTTFNAQESCPDTLGCAAWTHWHPHLQIPRSPHSAALLCHVPAVPPTRQYGVSRSSLTDPVQECTAVARMPASECGTS